MKPKTSPHPDGGVFSIAVSRPPLPTSDKGYRNGEESPLRNTDMPYIVMVIQSVIIFITLSAFILYVFSPRSMPHLSPTVAPSFTPHLSPTVAPSFTVTFENSALFPPPPPPSQPAVAVVDEAKQYPSAPHHSHTMLGKFRKAAVVSDHGICSEIGRSILTRGGNAVDAAIATLICVGATNPQSSGIGGGFFMQVYQKDSGMCTTINARETAPQNIDVKEYERTPDASSYGWKAIGVPGEVKGFWRAFSDYGSGKVAWKDLLTPTIKLCREGIPVSEYLAMILVNETKNVNKSNELREMFTNPATSKFYREGETMKREKLAKTLERLSEAEDPAALFYGGDMADTIVKEIRENGGYMDKEDLEDFQPLVRPAITSAITDGLTQCGPPPPSSWIVTQLIVRIMAELYPEPRRLEDLDSVLFYHRLIEAEKFAYARRTRLGDPQKYYNPGMEDTVKELTNPAAAKMYAARIRDEGPQANAAYEVKGYVKEDHGTSHVSVIDEQGNAVAVTSSINLWLGAKVASSLGIIWNNQMDDFGVPGVVNGFGFLPSKENYIAPGKAPLSSMSPTIIYDRDGQVRVVIGTTGGSKIIQGVASVVVRSLLFNQTIKEAIDAPQIWNQMQPDHVQYEKDFPEHIVAGLRAMGHKLQEEVNMRSTTHALFVDEATKYIYANSDKRSPVHMHPDGY